MANQKISQLTEQTDLSLIDGLAGYEGTSNVRISGPNIISAIPTMYSADDDLLAFRTVNDRTGGFTGTAGNNAIKFSFRNSGAIIIAGYLNNGNSGNANNLLRWGPGLTNGNMNVRGDLALSSGGGAIKLTNSGGQQYLTMAQTGTTINTNVGFGLTTGVSARLHVKGSGNTFATTSLLVENSNGDDLIKVLDSGRTSIGLNAINSNDNNVVFGNSASASGSTNNSVVIGTNSNITNSLNSVAVGGATLASGSSSSIAIGPAYINGVEAIAIGNSSRSNIGAVSIGHDSGSENNTGSYNLCLGTRAKNTSNANNVIVLNATGSTTATSGTTDDTFSVFMTSNTSPDFKVIGNEGMIPPNITTVTRDAIASPTVGSTIYNTTDNQLQYYNGDWRSIGVTPNSQLLAMTEITATATGNVTHDIHNFSSTPSNNLTAVNFNSDATNRYAKITFTPTYTGKAKIVFTSYTNIVGGSNDISVGLHDRATSTTTPVYGWFMIVEDDEPANKRILKAEWIVDVTEGVQFSGYVQAIANGSGNQFVASNYQGAAWSSSNKYAGPALVEAYSIENISITTNPIG